MAPSDQVRLLAFYLPQFHPIPENDVWWGKGFTEWRNVAKARPLFERHYQPHIPADLGFYDLRLPEARQAQADMAREHGIHGFCYYHYWFSGKRLLQRPFDEVLASGKPDFPFCLCWANENWTRRWDGQEKEILISQVYSEEDHLAHIRSLMPALRDPRYITVKGLPLLLIYRATSFPGPSATAALWRREAVKAGLQGLYLCTVISLPQLHCDPAALGFDAAVDFQPDFEDLPARELPQRPAPLRRIPRDDARWFNHVMAYPDLIERMIRRPDPGYRVFPGVTPSWDNSARLKQGAILFVDSTPELYGQWLSQAIAKTRQRFTGDERLVFINAWNEWAEGNHLEPDLKWGRAYLEATGEALMPNGTQTTNQQPSLEELSMEEARRRQA